MAIDSNEVVGELGKLFLEQVTKAKKITWAFLLNINRGSDLITAGTPGSLLPLKFVSRSCI